MVSRWFGIFKNEMKADSVVGVTSAAATVLLWSDSIVESIVSWRRLDKKALCNKSAPVCAHARTHVCVCVRAREEDNRCFAEVRDKDYFIPLRWQFKTLPWDSIECSKWKTIIKYALFFFIKSCLFCFVLLDHMGLSKLSTPLCLQVNRKKMSLSDSSLSGTSAKPSIHLSGCVHSGFSVLPECMGDTTKWEAQLSVDLIRLVITVQQQWKAN